MAGCGHCGGCCAHCGSTCGHLEGAQLGGIGSPFIGGFGNFGFYPYFGGWHRSKKKDDGITPIDADALVDPNHPGHRDAIQTISHIDDEKHGKLIAWLEEELHKLEHRSGPQQ